jgi:hypothetical protein
MGVDEKAQTVAFGQRQGASTVDKVPLTMSSAHMSSGSQATPIAARQAEDVRWPGSAEAVAQRITELAAEWRRQVLLLSDADLYDGARTRWPFADRPFSDIVGWLTVELAKNAAELGYVRFLYAARS